MQEMQEILEFVKFDPGPLCKSIKYDDHPGYHKLLNPQNDSASAQGSGAGARYEPLHLQFNMGPVDAATFVAACRANQKTAIKGLSYSSCLVFEQKRLKQVDMKYETLTIMSAQSLAQAGESDRLVVLDVRWVKAKGTIKQYDTKGEVESSLPVEVDLSKGFYSKL